MITYELQHMHISVKSQKNKNDISRNEFENIFNTILAILF